MDVLVGGLMVTAGVLLPLSSYKTASRGAGAEGAASARKTLWLLNIHSGEGAWFHLELDIAGREDLDLCTYEDWGTAVWERTALRPRHHI